MIVLCDGDKTWEFNINTKFSEQPNITCMQHSVLCS